MELFRRLKMAFLSASTVYTHTYLRIFIFNDLLLESEGVATITGFLAAVPSISAFCLDYVLRAFSKKEYFLL